MTMAWDQVMNRILPPTPSGDIAHVTSPFGAMNRTFGSVPHVGIDFNYIGGQTGVNLTHPDLYSPVDGKVTAVVAKTGMISITDANGYAHQILHTKDQYVQVGDSVTAGQPIGTMGGVGAGPGGTEGQQHVHYQVRDPNSAIVNPGQYWNGGLGVEPPGSVPLPQPRPDVFGPGASGNTTGLTLRDRTGQTGPLMQGPWGSLGDKTFTPEQSPGSFDPTQTPGNASGPFGAGRFERGSFGKPLYPTGSFDPSPTFDQRWNNGLPGIQQLLHKSRSAVPYLDGSQQFGANTTGAQPTPWVGNGAGADFSRQKSPLLSARRKDAG